MVCEAFDIYRSCYYAYRDRRRLVDVERLELRAKVNQKFKLSRSSAGSRMIKTMLNDDGIEIGRFKVRRLMAEIGLICKQPGPHAYKQATVERRVGSPDSIQRNSEMRKTSIKWLTTPVLKVA